ncbi:MAG: hypothetical protein ABR928_14710 [Terracidiphilus sp.]|jgi:hypothetical protein
MTGDRVEKLYIAAQRLYPERFRVAHSPAMLQAFRDARHDASLPHPQLISLIVTDFAKSLVKEHLAMVRDAFGRPALLFNAVVLAGISTVLALFLYAIPQQVLRLGANDPQIAMAGDAAARLEQGQPPSEAVPAGSEVDMARSLSPFVIAYDDAGVPVASQAQLNGQTPVPPRGVFDYVRTHGEERISWQPLYRDGQRVRIAAVVQRVGGTRPGFVLAGRSLREEESRQEQVLRMAQVAWLAMLALIVIGTGVFGWYTRPRAA